ncbi:hypothetical protein Pmar_PMAR024192 [Perkinsus marinus ATCC 50983]|uniref:Reverse transcriptase domain-containing protein n=1 Tax=Perkinsus marinus (strain ATCC 50983 / TXsc) TaxID=423536 RepID=C5L9F0_PERM5|nr:hypothetical protein Pmar_PMAR024192 [Perkinsus marinus ATCC 50983]EER06631.1 hypothetical protein Pmar_PMAR024192 [Perkinsus marinus ATCC 50983]|eukprot:XP_002774815.1 hypothetical protein Pmar_PMAR024192 [Perkinsus marinus ATCC 50983]
MIDPVREDEADPPSHVATETVLDDNECYRLIYRESSQRYEVYVKQAPKAVPYKRHGYKWSPIGAEKHLLREAFEDMVAFDAIAPGIPAKVVPARLMVAYGKRTRGVSDLRDYNEGCGSAPAPKGGVRKIMNDLRIPGCSQVAQMDISRAYYSILFFPDNPEVPVPAFEYDGRPYHYVRLPMGWVHSSRILAQVVSHALPTWPVKSGAYRSVYADNLCYVCSDEMKVQMEEWMARDRQALQDRGMWIKDSAVEWLTETNTLTILGYDLRRQGSRTMMYVRMKPLPRAVRKRDLLVINGYAYDELFVTGIGGYKALLSSVAMAGVPADRKKEYMGHHLEPGVINLSEKIKQKIVTAQGKGVMWAPRLGEPLMIYTDASTSGWGFKVMQGADVLARGSGRWPKDQRLWGMPTKEAMAALRGLTSIPPSWTEMLPVEWMTDSATTLSALAKISRGGDVPAMNVTFRRRVAEIAEWLRLHAKASSVKVDTKLNKADGLSRRG